MDENKPSQHGTWLATVCWLFILTILFLFQPGQWSLGGNYIRLNLGSWVCALSVMFLFTCRVQGLGWAIPGVIALLSTALPVAEHPRQSVFLLNETLLVATLGLLFILWSIVSERRFDLQSCLVWWIGVVTIATAIWLEAFQTGKLRETLSPDDAIMAQRLRQWSFGLLILGGWLGAIVVRQGPVINRVFAVFATTVTPGLGFLLATTQATFSSSLLLDGAEWSTLPSQWFGSESAWKDHSWAWMSPSILLGLIAFGLYRLFSRGWKMWAAKEVPLPWLLLLMSLGSVAVLLPGSTNTVTSLIMTLLGIWIPLFIVGDLVILTVEGMVRKPPEPGPSQVPRVH